MSQYAFYLSKKRKTWLTCPAYFVNEGLSHNGYELDHIFGIQSCRSISSRLFQYLYIKFKQKGKVFRLLSPFCHEIIEAEDYAFNGQLIERQRSPFSFFYGGWHSEKYFKDIEAEIKKVFSFDETKLNAGSRVWRDEIISCCKSCSIHIRRGDYLTHPYFNNIATLDYYRRAIDLICKEYGTVEFYVFSNDVEWCQSHFGNDHFHYVNCNSSADSWQDMYLISRCHHHINANSTFSWWGAWLCPYKDSVTIVPKQFTTLCETPDIYPDRWLKL